MKLEFLNLLVKTGWLLNGPVAAKPGHDKIWYSFTFYAKRYYKTYSLATTIKIILNNSAFLS